MVTPTANMSNGTYNLEPNIAGALAYLLTPFTGVLFLVIEKENKFVRLHAMQSIIFGIAAIVASSVASASLVILIGIILIPLVSITTFILWLLLMWKAFNNEEYLLPIIGKIAKDQIYK